MVRSTWLIKKQPNRPIKKKYEDEIDTKKTSRPDLLVSFVLKLNHIELPWRGSVYLASLKKTLINEFKFS
jgi:hypothetical protein